VSAAMARLIRKVLIPHPQPSPARERGYGAVHVRSETGPPLLARLAGEGGQRAPHILAVIVASTVSGAPGRLLDALNGCSM
jgi:hypothetical protein